MDGKKLDFKSEKDVPVLLVIFNRPEKVETLISKLRKVQIKNIYVSADGPRDNNENDLKKCKEARGLIDTIDWDCEVHKKFSPKNLGLSLSMETAIDWFFENNEAGIIFEDDCIPNKDFFSFVKEILNKYSDNEEIMMVSGTNFQGKNIRGDASYFFSNYPRIWGWATWKRAWKLYDKERIGLPDFLEQNKISRVFPDKKEQDFWNKNFSNPYIDPNGIKRLTWATTWAYSVFNNCGITIVPNNNLVQNIGYGEDSTHTNSSGRGWSLETEKMEEIVHPAEVKVDQEADRFYFKTQHYKNLWNKFYNQLNVFLDRIHIKPILVVILKKIGLRK